MGTVVRGHINISDLGTAIRGQIYDMGTVVRGLIMLDQHVFLCVWLQEHNRYIITEASWRSVDRYVSVLPHLKIDTVTWNTQTSTEAASLHAQTFHLRMRSWAGSRRRRLAPRRRKNPRDRRKRQRRSSTPVSAAACRIACQRACLPTRSRGGARTADQDHRSPEQKRQLK